MRLDIFLYTNGYFQSRNKAAEAILRGEVYLNGVKILKPSFLVNGESNCDIEIVSENNFVSVGGYKLYKAFYANRRVLKKLLYPFFKKRK